MSSVGQITAEISAISYEIEHDKYTLCNEEWQWLVFKQVEKDASMVGLQLDWKPNENLASWYDALKQMLTQLLMHGDVRNFLYRIDVSEKKIRQITDLSVDDLCILVLERAFQKVCIRKHFSK